MGEISVIRLKGDENLGQWKNYLRSALEAEDLHKHIFGNVTPLAINAPEEVEMKWTKERG